MDTLLAASGRTERATGATGGRIEAVAAQTDTGAVLSLPALRRLCCDATITRVLLTADGAPLDAGRDTRLVPPGMRRALVARDRCCAFPGCDRPPNWCQAHHVIHWINDGATELPNLVLLCGHHHRRIHAGDWEVRIAADGLPELLPPPWIDPDRRPRRNPHNRHPATLLQGPGPPPGSRAA